MRNRKELKLRCWKVKSKNRRWLICGALEEKTFTNKNLITSFSTKYMYFRQNTKIDTKDTSFKVGEKIGKYIVKLPALNKLNSFLTSNFWLRIPINSISCLIECYRNIS